MSDLRQPAFLLWIQNIGVVGAIKLRFGFIFQAATLTHTTVRITFLVDAVAWKKMMSMNMVAHCLALNTNTGLVVGWQKRERKFLLSKSD